MKEKLRKILEPVLGAGVIFALVFGVLAVIALFSGSIMRLFGFRYDSVWSIILFFIASAAVGFPLEIIASAFPRALVTAGKVSGCMASAVFVMLDTVFSCITMMVVDYFMDSVSANSRSLLVISLLFALLTLKDFKEKLAADNERER